MENVGATQELVRFGVFELNVTTEELRKSGTLIRLAPQPLKLLVLLARRSGLVVTREEIREALWGGDTYVDFEQGMNQCIKQIRTALSDNAETPLYIETVPRRGYRFLAPVVTKTIPAPTPRVVESQSGVQARVPMPPVPTTVVAPARAVVIDPTAPLKPQPLAPAPVQEPAAPAEPTPAASPVRWKLIAIVALLLLVIVAGIVYWRSRKTAILHHQNSLHMALNTAEPKHAFHAPPNSLRALTPRAVWPCV